MELPKCYRCGRTASDTAGQYGYWCSWCGQAFDPKDEDKYRRQEAERKERERSTFLAAPHLPANSAVALSSQCIGVKTCICSAGGVACRVVGCFATSAIPQL